MFSLLSLTALHRWLMCPQFNLVFEETPRKFLHRQRKTSLGEKECLSKPIDQAERGKKHLRRLAPDLSVSPTVPPLSLAATCNLSSVINCLVAGSWMQTEEGFVFFFHLNVFLFCFFERSQMVYFASCDTWNSAASAHNCKFRILNRFLLSKKKKKNLFKFLFFFLFFNISL